MDFQDVAKYKYDELTVPAEELPAGVDPSCREVRVVLHCYHSHDTYYNVTYKRERERERERDRERERNVN